MGRYSLDEQVSLPEIHTPHFGRTVGSNESGLKGKRNKSEQIIPKLCEPEVKLFHAPSCVG